MLPIRDELLNLARRLVESGANDESLLAAIRDSGSSVIDSIKVLHVLRGYDLGKAKETVHMSKAWSDRRQEFDEFHEDLIEAVRDMNGVQYEEEE